MNVDKIADFFILRSRREEAPIRMRKLHQLLYYAYLWYVVIYDKELFEEELSAFPLGPVAQSQMDRFKDSAGLLAADIDPVSFPQKTEDFLNAVFSDYRQASIYNQVDGRIHKKARRSPGKVIRPKEIRSQYTPSMAEAVMPKNISKILSRQ